MPGLISRAKRNIAFKFIGEITSRLLMLLLYIYAARKLGNTGFGKYSFAYSFCALFMIFIDLGLNTLLVRDIAKQREKTANYVSNITMIKLGASLFVFLLITLIVNILGYPPDMKILIQLMAVMTAGVGFLDFIGSVFCAWEKMNYESWIKIFNKVLVSFFGIGLLYLGYGLIAFSGAVAASYVISAVLGIYLVQKIITRIKFTFDLKFWYNLVKTAFPLGLANVFILIYLRADVVMLGFLGAPEGEVGWYSASRKIIESLESLPYLITWGMLPIISDMYGRDREVFARINEKVFKFMMIICMPVVFGLFVLSDKITLFIYGEGFIESSISLKILIWAVIFLFSNYIFTNMLVVIEKQRYIAASTFLTVIVNLGMNILLIPRLGYIGATIALLFTQVAAVVLMLYFLNGLVDIKFVASAWKPFLAGLAMGVFLYLLRDMNLFILAAGGAVIYVFSIYLLKTFTENDYVIIRKLLG